MTGSAALQECASLHGVLAVSDSTGSVERESEAVRSGDGAALGSCSTCSDSTNSVECEPEAMSSRGECDRVRVPGEGGVGSGQ